MRPRTLQRPVSLSEVLDRVLNKGVVVTGEVVLSVGGIDLVYLGLNVVLTSIETARQAMAKEMSDAAAR
jgi:orotate phosphoribosyltransferase